MRRYELCNGCASGCGTFAGSGWRLGHNRVSDGIPLRVDLHRALDRGLIELNKRNQLVWVSPELNGMYGEYLVASKPGKRAYPLNKS